MLMSSPYAYTKKLAYNKMQKVRSIVLYMGLYALYGSVRKAVGICWGPVTAHLAFVWVGHEGIKLVFFCLCQNVL